MIIVFDIFIISYGVVVVNTPQHLYISFVYGIFVVNMPVGDFKGISIRKEVYDSINSFITAHPEMGYRTVAQFVTDAVREKLIELNARLGGGAGR